MKLTVVSRHEDGIWLGGTDDVQDNIDLEPVLQP